MTFSLNALKQTKPNEGSVSGPIVYSSTKPVFFIADLHLSPALPNISQCFLRFLTAASNEAAALYILGDLFESWAGDDDWENPFNRQIIDSLAKLTATGVPSFLLHGNRDFLLGPTFAAQSGVHLITDPSAITIGDVPTLLSHGDTLCTLDQDYQQFRTTVRHPTWQKEFLARPLTLRKMEIEMLRHRSTQAKEQKASVATDVTPQAVIEVLHHHHCRRLIHGHTHRPARHTHLVDNHDCERWVLPSWDNHLGGHLRCNANGCTWEGDETLNLVAH